MDEKKLKVWAWVLSFVLIFGTIFYLSKDDKYTINLQQINSNRVRGKFIGLLRKTRYPQERFERPIEPTGADLYSPLLIDENKIVVCEDATLKKEVWSKTFEGKIVSWYVDYVSIDNYLCNVFLIINGTATNRLVCIREQLPKSRIVIPEVLPSKDKTEEDYINEFTDQFFRKQERSNEETPPGYKMLYEAFSIPVDAVKIIACSHDNATGKPIVCVQNKNLDKIVTIGFDGKITKATTLDKPTYFAENCMKIGNLDSLPEQYLNIGFDGRFVKYYDLKKDMDFKPVALVDTKAKGDIFKSRIECVDELFKYCRDFWELEHSYLDGFFVFTGSKIFQIKELQVETVIDKNVEGINGAVFDEFLASNSKIYESPDFEPINCGWKTKIIAFAFPGETYAIQEYNGCSKFGMLGGNKMDLRWPFSRKSALIHEMIESICCTYSLHGNSFELYIYTDKSVYVEK